MKSNILLALTHAAKHCFENVGAIDIKAQNFVLVYDTQFSIRYFISEFMIAQYNLFNFRLFNIKTY